MDLLDKYNTESCLMHPGDYAIVCASQEEIDKLSLSFISSGSIVKIKMRLISGRYFVVTVTTAEKRCFYAPPRILTKCKKGVILSCQNY